MIHKKIEIKGMKYWSENKNKPIYTTYSNDKRITQRTEKNQK
ncbi:hypothetical protein [Aquimarina hainanensis]